MIDEKTLRMLREERRNFIRSISKLDERVQENKMTVHERDFILFSNARSIDPEIYLRGLNDDIAKLELSMKYESYLKPNNMNYYAAGALLVIILFASLFMFYGPTITGMLGFSQEQGYMIQLNQTFENNSVTEYALNISEGRFTSLRIDGRYYGDVKVYLVQNYTKIDNETNQTINVYNKYLVFEPKKKELSAITGMEILEPTNVESNTDNMTENVSVAIENNSENIIGNITIAENLTANNLPIENISQNNTENITENISENITEIVENVIENISESIENITLPTEPITENITLTTEPIAETITPITEPVTENIEERIKRIFQKILP